MRSLEGLKYNISISWNLSSKEYLTFSHDCLLHICIEHGFIPSYEFLALQLILSGSSPEAHQDTFASKISASTYSLYEEILSSESNLSKYSQLRILGLVSTSLCSGKNLPIESLANIKFENDCIDIFTLIMFTTRCYNSFKDVSRFLISNGNSTPIMNWFAQYLEEIENPLMQRNLFLNRENHFKVEIKEYPDFSQILSALRSINFLIQSGNFTEAYEQNSNLMNSYKSINQCFWIQNYLNIMISQTPCNNLFIHDPLFGCTDRENFVSQYQWKQSIHECDKQLSTCIAHRFRRSLDPFFRNALSKKYNCIYTMENLSEEKEIILHDFIEKNVILSDFDPFQLTITRGNIFEYCESIRSTDKTKFHFNDKNFKFPPTCLIVGLPSPYTLYPDFLKLATNNTSLNADLTVIDDYVEESMFKSSNTFNYPFCLSKISQENIEEIRKFYLQNLAFLDPSGKANSIYICSEKSFIRIALYQYVMGCNSVIEVLPDINDWLVKSRFLLDGYNCDFTIPSFPELIAFASDYFGIMKSWMNTLPIKKCLIYKDKDGIYKYTNINQQSFRIAPYITQSLNQQSKNNYSHYLSRMMSELSNDIDYLELLQSYDHYLSENVS